MPCMENGSCWISPLYSLMILIKFLLKKKTFETILH